MAMMETTTSSSTSVKPGRRALFADFDIAEKTIAH
jgi:hypothetical protein